MHMTREEKTFPIQLFHQVIHRFSLNYIIYFFKLHYTHGNSPTTSHRLTYRRCTTRIPLRKYAILFFGRSGDAEQQVNGEITEHWEMGYSVETLTCKLDLTETTQIPPHHYEKLDIAIADEVYGKPADHLFNGTVETIEAGLLHNHNTFSKCVDLPIYGSSAQNTCTTCGGSEITETNVMILECYIRKIDFRATDNQVMIHISNFKKYFYFNVN